MPNRIDLPRCTELWHEQDRALFNQLPIYMAKTQTERFKWYSRFTKILNSVNWEPNKGTTMQGVRKVPSPITRGQALPNPITSAPLKDVIEVRETGESVQVYKHDFESQLMHFLPSFQDFLTDHVDATLEDITEKIQVYVDLFYRTAIFHGSPKVWVCGKTPELTTAAYWTGTNIALSKSANNLQQLVQQVKSSVTLATLRKLRTVMRVDEDIVPFSGRVLADGTDGKALAYKYLLIMGTEVWDSFIEDSDLLDNRALNLDIVTDGFTGSLYGSFTTMFERFEMRIAADGTIPAPQVVEEGAAAYNLGEPVMNPTYVNSPYGVMWAVGAESYKALKVGPPPKDWRKMSMKEFANLNWNGQVDMTQNVLVPCLDGNGAATTDTNKRGEYLQLIAAAVMGILPIQRKNIIPIIYARSRVGS